MSPRTYSKATSVAINTRFSAPRKRFGQHFLHDDRVIQDILSAISPLPSQHIVEIGPGQGALTLPLLSLCQTLEVVEIDRDLYAPLKAQCAGRGELLLHEADALTFDFGALCSDGRALRLVGNLPYNISTPLIFHLLTFTDRIDDMHFMLQKEVAARLAAVPCTKDYGRLSVMVQYHCAVSRLFDVGPDAFTPPPKVDSSVVRLKPFRVKPVTAASFEHFSALVKAAFAMRRKTLRNCLKTLLAVCREDVPIDLGRRAEELSVAEFVALSNCLIGGD